MGRGASMADDLQHDESRRDDTTVRSSPGASGPGEPGYDGAATVGDEGGAGHPEGYQDPFGRPDPSVAGDDPARTGDEQAARNREDDPPA